jgi:hypothetical protein
MAWSTVQSVTIKGGAVIEGSIGAGKVGDCNSTVSTVEIDKSAVRGSKIGGGLKFLRLESAIVECTDEVEQECLQANELVLSVSVTGRTNTPRFFGGSTMTFGDNIFVFVRYARHSDPENLTVIPSVHFREIDYPFGGRYAVSRGSGARYFVEMEGREKGLLVSMASGPTLISFWQLPGGRMGKIVTNHLTDITIGDGETVVDRPNFIWATMKFTTGFNPWARRRVIFMVMNFCYLTLVDPFQ